MPYDDSELEEFRSEAMDLIEEAEKNLLEFENGQLFRPCYDAVFRCFHSLKGAAGMLELEYLRNHMHHLEDLFAGYKDSQNISPLEITFFLEGIDATKRIVSGENIEFKFDIPKIKLNEEKTTFKKTDIFIIDDEEDLVQILGNYMTKSQFSWKGFTDPSLAMQEIESNPPSLVISDLRMPKMDGLTLLKNLRKISKDIPFIIISAELSKESLLEAISQGVAAVIEKPFRESQVVAQVTQTFHQSELNELLNRAIEVLMFHMPDLEQFLILNNKSEILKILKRDVTGLLSKRRQLKQMSLKQLS
jgi:PleD family two-component response regulator